MPIIGIMVMKFESVSQKAVALFTVLECLEQCSGTIQGNGSTHCTGTEFSLLYS